MDSWSEKKLLLQMSLKTPLTPWFFFLINWPTQLYLGIQSNPLKHDDIRTWRDQKATWRYLSRWTSLWISILSAALNFGQFWTMAAQCVIKEKKKRPEILVMNTIYTLWTIHKTTEHYNYKKKTYILCGLETPKVQQRPFWQILFYD